MAYHSMNGGYVGFGEGRFGRDPGAGIDGSGNNNLLSPNQGHLQPQSQSQSQQQQTGPNSPSYGSMQNGYRSPSVSSPNHQHVGPNQMEFPANPSSVTPEQAARYGIAGLGQPLGSAGAGAGTGAGAGNGIGAWMDGVNAAGVKSAGGNGSGWLESSPLQQQQQQQHQQQQQAQSQQNQGNGRRNLGDREGAVSAALPSPAATGNASPFAPHGRPGAQDVGGANWSGFPGGAGSEQGRNQGQGQGQAQGQAQQGNNGQTGQGKPQNQQRGSQSAQGQAGSRPSSSAQQRQQSSQSQQSQQQQQQGQDEVVDGNNAGDANGESLNVIGGSIVPID